MRRTVVTHVARAEEWLERANAGLEVQEDIARGMRAFAYRQANVWSSHAIQCIREWIPFLEKNKITIDWPEKLRSHAEWVQASCLSEQDEFETSRQSGRADVEPNSADVPGGVSENGDTDYLTDRGIVAEEREETAAEGIEGLAWDSDCDNTADLFTHLTSDESCRSYLSDDEF